MTPSVIDWNRVRKLNEAIASSATVGAQPVKKSSTIGAPDTVSRKLTTTATTNAMTWFLVAAEMQPPIAR